MLNMTLSPSGIFALGTLPVFWRKLAGRKWEPGDGIAGTVAKTGRTKKSGRNGKISAKPTRKKSRPTPQARNLSKCPRTWSKQLIVEILQSIFPLNLSSNCFCLKRLQQYNSNLTQTSNDHLRIVISNALFKSIRSFSYHKFPSVLECYLSSR